MKAALAKILKRKTKVFDPADGLLPTRTFWAIIDRERNLADRGADRRFAVLAFDVEHGSRNGELSEQVSKAVLSRLRKSDLAGWLDASRIGVLLADARALDAERVAHAICERVAAGGVRPHCLIFEYPARDTGGDGPGAPPGPKPSRGWDELKHPRKQDDAPAATGADGDVASSRITILDDQAMMDLLTPPVPWWKRAVDSTLAAVAVILLSPVFVGMAVLIKTVSRGPVFFRQQRIGRAGRTFDCWKFRTMHVGADTSVHARHVSQLIASSVPMTKLDVAEDKRVIPFGRLIRASGLDELPQLFNVLCGDMSLVGPRPCIAYEYERYELWHRRRCDTLPGITGLWQVNGKNRNTFGQMMRYDVSYASHPTMQSDLLILARTLPAVVTEVICARKTQKGER
jgi:lipopolysaccharide/colanic/teichoic acid biosynthesis glycosyltransferase